MAKRFGRNQKRAVLQQLNDKQLEINKWVQHCSYAQARLQEYVRHNEHLQDVGLRIETYNSFERDAFDMRVSLLDAHSLIKLIGDRIYYG